MNDPIKIIYKAKNNNAKAQYYIYIYVGNVPQNVSKILDKIKNASLADTLQMLTRNEITDITTYYGDKWYTFFFNKYHIITSRNIMTSNEQIMAELKKKYGEQWVSNNIIQGQQYIERKHTYGNLIKRKLIHHELRTQKAYVYTPRQYTNYTTISDTRREYNVMQQKGGEYENNDDQGEINTNDDSIGIDTENIFSDRDEDDDETEMELEQSYMDSNVIISKNNVKITSMLKKVMGDENILKKKETKMIKFDQSKDTTIYHENLSEVYTKIYVTEQYIFRDDSIINIRNKICCSIKNNPKFGSKCYIMPSRQYIWGEYQFGNVTEKIMIGTKWLQRNEMLKIDIEPNENIKVYEELRDTIKLLSNDLKRFNSKIKREDDDTNILFDYDGYYDNNELYMIDIYNELGKDYKPTTEELNNLMDTYVKIYFPKITRPDMKHILDYLNNDQIIEREKMISVVESISTDLLLENEIVNLVEKTKNIPNYQRIMKDNSVTQSMISLLLRSNTTDKFKRIDLFKIFDDMIPSEKYPFVQYMTNDGNVSFKFNEHEMNTYMHNPEIRPVVQSWFQTMSHGLSFRIKIDNVGEMQRFMTINISELGRLDYKIQWKENDGATVDDITKTYLIVKELINEINATSIKHKFHEPDTNEFKTAFITTIQRFVLDNEYEINHNDLSKFARYFYPYFALVIEPRKRVSKLHEETQKSKFGTYLRYKRITKYENSTKIEKRIYYLVRNYEYTDQLIINEISKQFNLTQEKSAEHFKRTMQKYTHVRKARKELKKFDVSPKSKSPGIDIAIQGKERDKYKIRISGARDKQQLQRIITILNVMIYLYMETYLSKNPDFQYIKDKLRKLNNIAERRHTVSDFVKYSGDKTNIKAMANVDKRRIGYKPTKGQSNWSRVCQNSGNQQRRRPQQYVADDIETMLKQGYALNEATGMYERKVVTKKNGKNIVQTIRAVKLNELDETGTPIGNEIYYTCSPEQNGVHMYVGFLTRSKNPNGEYMPCCFKKDQSSSDNIDKRNFFMKCIGKDVSETDKTPAVFNDQLYILQDTNKIQPDRFGFLPKILDFYLNTLLELKAIVTQHYLIMSPDGYFFKYGINHETNSFVSAIASALDRTPEYIMYRVIDSLSNDKSDQLFTSLNNGDIKNEFVQREKYINYLKNISLVDYERINHILTIPSVIMMNGINIIIIVKVATTMDIQTDSTLKDNCYIVCSNSEELNNLYDSQRETIILYKEHDNYYPIFNVTKKLKTTKDIIVTKTFKYENIPKNIINHIKDFYNENCMGKTIKSIINKDTTIIAKSLYKKLIDMAIPDYIPKYQYVDIKNKCRGFILNNGMILPVAPSGTIYNVAIITKTTVEKYCLSFSDTLNRIRKMYEIFSELPIQPTSVNGTLVMNDKINVRSIILQTDENIPVLNEVINITDITSENLGINTDPSFENIDNLLENSNKNNSVDERKHSVDYIKYYNESYELFRYVFSDVLNRNDYKSLRNKLIKILNSNISHDIKLMDIRAFLYKCIDTELYNIFIELTGITREKPDTQYGGKIEKFIQIIENEPNTDGYRVKNTRNACYTCDKNVCSNNIHYKWTHSGCKLALTKNMVVTFINKLSSEIVDNEMKANEILRINDYYVSDVVNKKYYTERENQKIIKSTSNNITQTIEMFFNKNDIRPKIRMYHDIQTNDNEYIDINKKNPLRDYGKYYVQDIIQNNNSILRAYANGFNWLENKYQDINNRNMGYYSRKQTDIMVYLKSLMIDWILDDKNSSEFSILLNKYTTIKTTLSYVTKLATDITTTSNGILELFILNKIQNTPVILYANDIVQRVFDGDIIKSELERYENIKNAINIQYTYDSDAIHNYEIRQLDIPNSVSVIYFK